jgi:hypothetical protein
VPGQRTNLLETLKTGESLDAARLWQGDARWLARLGGGNEPEDWWRKTFVPSIASLAFGEL